MQQIITAKLKLLVTPEQHQLLRQTQLAYRDALNYVSRYAFEQGKTSSNDRLQQGTYHEIRVLYGLPSQMACNVPRQVAGTYKGLWTKLKQNLVHRKAGHTKKRYKGLDKPPKYVSPTLTYNYGYDYSFKKEQRVSVLTLNGRTILSYQGYNQHVALIQHGATIGAAKLWYDKPHKQYYLLVSLELKLPDPMPEALPNVVGVDVGMRYLATTATTANTSHFYPGKRVRARADHETRLQKRLQKKGTRSATRRKIALAGRERRLKLQTNHTIAKQIVNAHPHTLIGLEELSGIRERTRRRKWRRKKNGKGTEGAQGPSQSPRFQVGLCRTAQHDRLQGGLVQIIPCHQGRPGLHQPGVPAVRLHEQAQPPRQGPAVHLPQRAVSPPAAHGPTLHAARRSGGCAQYRDANVSHSAGLGENGRLVSTPRCVGQ